MKYRDKKERGEERDILLIYYERHTPRKNVISVPIKIVLHHYPRANFYDIPGSMRERESSGKEERD